MKTISSRGPALFLLSSFLFALMGVFVKLASPYVSANEIALVRFIIGILLSLALAGVGRISLAASHKKLLVARGVFGGLAVVFFFAAIEKGTLTNATLLNNTYPIFATVWAAFYLKERIKPSIVIPLIASIAGIVLLTHPNLSQIRYGDVFGLISGVLAGFSIVIIRKLRLTESAWSVFFYLSIFGAAFSGAAAIPDFRIPEPQIAGYIVLAGILGTVGQVIMTSAYKYTTASLGSVLSMSTAMFAALFGMIFMGEMLTVMESAGALVILLSSGYLAYYNNSEASKSNETKKIINTDA